MSEPTPDTEYEQRAAWLKPEPKTGWPGVVETGDLGKITDFLSQGVDVNACDSIGGTALMFAIRDGYLDIIRLLLDHGASLGSRNSYVFSPMTMAVLRSLSGSRRWYIHREPDDRPLQMLLEAGGRYGLHEAVFLGDVSLARVCLDEGADPNAGERTYHGPLLSLAAKSGDGEIVSLLIDRGAELEGMDDLGQRALLRAAEAGRTEVVEILLERGAEIDATDWFGRTALGVAVFHGHEATASLLLARGAKRRILDALALGDEALIEERLLAGDSAVGYSLDSQRIAMIVARRGNVEAMGRVLADVVLEQDEWTGDHSLLAEAASHGRLEMVRFLVERGFELHVADRQGLTPLASALKIGHEAVASYLRGAGAER